jgi:hypothetical protein
MSYVGEGGRGKDFPEVTPEVTSDQNKRKICFESWTSRMLYGQFHDI